MTWDGYTSLPEILGEGNDTVDGIQWRPFFDDEPLYCGKEAKRPCLQVEVFRINEKQYEQWAITYQFTNVIWSRTESTRKNLMMGSLPSGQLSNGGSIALSLKSQILNCSNPIQEKQPDRRWG